MTPEHKQQAKQLIADWTNVSRTSTPAVWFLNADCMAGFLQELVDAPTPEPFGYFKAEPFGWTDCAETDDGAIALFAAPPAPSVPDVAQTIPSHDQITQILNGLDRCGVAESKRAFLRTWIRDWTAHKLAAAPTPAEAPEDLVQDSVASEPVGYLYTNLQSGEYHVSDADDDYRGPERALWCIEPVYRRAKGQS